MSVFLKREYSDLGKAVKYCKYCGAKIGIGHEDIRICGQTPSGKNLWAWRCPSCKKDNVTSYYPMGEDRPEKVEG